MILEGLWCVRGPLGGSSWLGWWAGVWAAPRSTGLGFIPASPGSASGFWATQIPAWSTITPGMFPLCQLLWQEEASIIHQYPGPYPWTCYLHQHYLVMSHWKQNSFIHQLPREMQWSQSWRHRHIITNVELTRWSIMSSSLELQWKLPVQRHLLHQQGQPRVWRSPRLPQPVWRKKLW